MLFLNIIHKEGLFLIRNSAHKAARPILDYYARNKLFKFLLLSTPVLIFVLGFLLHPNSVIKNDWDYFLQLYEAFRISILEYRQFPWWNPWVAGGVPLFANPQFALFSIESVSVLILGSLYGLKIAVLVYYILGFWGMYKLSKRITSNEPRSVLVAYIFTFGGFTASHISVGHLTFAMYLLVPWLLYLFVIRFDTKYSFLYFALFIAFFINSSPHYIVIQSAILVVILYLFDYARRFINGYTMPIRKDLAVFFIASILCIHKLVFAYQYVSFFPRDIDTSASNSLALIFSSVFQPYYTTVPLSNYSLLYGWHEYYAYTGLLLIILILIILYRQIFYKKERYVYSNLCFFVGAIALLISMGPFSSWSPYMILSRMPILKNMSVPSRWVGWAVLFLLIGILLSKAKIKFFNTILLIIVIELFLINRLLFFHDAVKFIPPVSRAKFDTFTDYEKNDSNRFYKSTLANLSEVHGYEPIIGYQYDQRPTKRIGSNLGGKLISDNAEIVSFTPNKIVIKRLSEGNIILNINPSNYWRVNGKQIFRAYRAVEINEVFEIDDPSETIVCEVKPSYSLLIPKL